MSFDQIRNTALRVLDLPQAEVPPGVRAAAETVAISDGSMPCAEMSYLMKFVQDYHLQPGAAATHGGAQPGQTALRNTTALLTALGSKARAQMGDERVRLDAPPPPPFGSEARSIMEEIFNDPTRPAIVRKEAALNLTLYERFGGFNREGNRLLSATGRMQVKWSESERGYRIQAGDSDKAGKLFFPPSPGKLVFTGSSGPEGEDSSEIPRWLAAGSVYPSVVQLAVTLPEGFSWGMMHGLDGHGGVNRLLIKKAPLEPASGKEGAEPSFFRRAALLAGGIFR